MDGGFVSRETNALAIGYRWVAGGNRQIGPLGWREHPSPRRTLALAHARATTLRLCSYGLTERQSRLRAGTPRCKQGKEVGDADDAVVGDLDAERVRNAGCGEGPPRVADEALGAREVDDR